MSAWGHVNSCLTLHDEHDYPMIHVLIIPERVQRQVG